MTVRSPSVPGVICAGRLTLVLAIPKGEPTVRPSSVWVVTSVFFRGRVNVNVAATGSVRGNPGLPEVYWTVDGPSQPPSASVPWIRVTVPPVTVTDPTGV